jgi:sporulation protein YlmC with PRC-barrel domain
MSGEIHVERLVGRTVRDSNGARVGRLSEVVVRKEDGAFVVASYLVGPQAWLHRFAVHGLGLRLGRIARIYRVPWEQLDLSDPKHPVTTCPRDDLVVEHLPPRKRGLKRRPGRPLR